VPNFIQIGQTANRLFVHEQYVHTDVRPALLDRLSRKGDLKRWLHCSGSRLKNRSLYEICMFIFCRHWENYETGSSS